MKRPVPNRRLPNSIALLALFAFLTGSIGAATLPGLRVSEDGHHFIREDGSPFLYLADTAWGLCHFTREDVDLYLKDRAAKRFTVIQCVVAHYGGLDRPNPYGQTVFGSNDPARPNEAYFEHVDYIINKAASLGLHVALVPIWSKEYVNQQHSVLTESTAQSYGQFLGRRYRDKPVLWILGGDWFADGVENIWRALAAGIAEGDGGTHLKTYHPKSPRSSAQWFHRDAWLDFNMLQTGHTILNRNYDLVAEDYSRTPSKPVVDGEGGYEGIAEAFRGNGFADQEKIEAHDVRRIAYCAVFAGAAGYAYGGHGVWGYRSPTGSAGARRTASQALPGGAEPPHGVAPSFQDGLQLPGSTQMQYLRALIESRPLLKLIPDQWLVVNDYMGTTNRIQACRASDGSYAFIYTAAGTKLRVRLIDRIYPKLSGETIRAYWYDPRQGKPAVIGEFPKTEWHEFTPPTTGPGNDWVLVLDDAAMKFPAPGARPTAPGL